MKVYLNKAINEYINKYWYTDDNPICELRSHCKNEELMKAKRTPKKVSLVINYIYDKYTFVDIPIISANTTHDDLKINVELSDDVLIWLQNKGTNKTDVINSLLAWYFVIEIESKENKVFIKFRYDDKLARVFDSHLFAHRNDFIINSIISHMDNKNVVAIKSERLTHETRLSLNESTAKQLFIQADKMNISVNQLIYSIIYDTLQSSELIYNNEL